MNAEALKHLKKSDKALAKVINKVGLCPLEPDPATAPYQALIRSVVYQQLSGKAAGTIFERFKALYPRRRFPKPEDILATDMATLRSAGLSQAKALAILDIAAKTKEGLVPSSKAIAKLENDEIIERLTSIRGVGQWTVEMLLIFKLGRMDVLPATDYGVRKGFAKILGAEELPTPKELMAYGERWKPFRSYAAWYLWRALELKD